MLEVFVVDVGKKFQIRSKTSDFIHIKVKLKFKLIPTVLKFLKIVHILSLQYFLFFIFLRETNRVEINFEGKEKLEMKHETNV